MVYGEYVHGTQFGIGRNIMYMVSPLVVQMCIPPDFKSITNGPEILHGGTFGIEGSIITTIMLSIASIVLWKQLWGEKQTKRF